MPQVAALRLRNIPEKHMDLGLPYFCSMCFSIMTGRWSINHVFFTNLLLNQHQCFCWAIILSLTNLHEDVTNQKMLRISTHRNITHQGVETMFFGLYSQYLWQKIPKFKNDALLFEVLQFLMVKSEFCQLCLTTASRVLYSCILANHNKKTCVSSSLLKCHIHKPELLHSTSILTICVAPKLP